MKNLLLLSLIVGFSLIIGISTTPVAFAAVDMFLKITGVEGESTDHKHKNDIDILAWSWGMSQSGTTHVGGGGGAGKANFQDLSFTKFVDKSTPTLMLHVANGGSFSDAELFVRSGSTETTGVEYFKIKMTRVLVSSISTGGSGGDDRLIENVSLNFGQVKVTYTPITTAGTAGTCPSTQSCVFDWDIVENRPPV